MTRSDETTRDRLAATLAMDEPVGRVRLVSPTRAKALQALGIRTIRDLVTHYPRKYIDLSTVRTIGAARVGEQCTIEGTAHEVRLKRPRPRLSLVEISVIDDTGVLMVTMFNQPWLMDSIKPGTRVAVAGRLEFNYGYKRMTSPYLEKIEEDSDENGLQICGQVMAVHPACEKINTTMMRRLVRNALDEIRGTIDPLPVDLRCAYHLMSRNQALECIHFPVSIEEQQAARRRLAYEELLLLELRLMQQAAARSEGVHPIQHETAGPLLTALRAEIPFELTGDQQCAINEVLGVMAADSCANHLVLGDVGTGKTIVAACALAAAVDTGCQALLMAPTEVLAQQHAKSLGELFDAIGVRWALLTGSTLASEKETICEQLADGSLQVCIGTHALLEPTVQPLRCSLVVIDEQQRFGVDQRAALLAKGEAVDALYLTATPIPRSLALALYGDLSLSYLKQRPFAAAGRTTTVLHRNQQGSAYDAALEALVAGQQVYVVCPLVGMDTAQRNAKAQGSTADAPIEKPGKKKSSRNEEEEVYEYSLISIENDQDLDGGDLAAATREAEFLSSKTFVDYEVELLHGQMPSEQKRAVMERFAQGETQVLVATTVIEVGVDVPNATVMIIQDADRFGLSQLHQLRGRVGRGELPGQVFLISNSRTDAAMQRLDAMVHTDDGFELAEYDLSLRREGDILGNRQSGASTLKLVNVVRDGRIIQTAHADAARILSEDPHLESPEHAALAREMRIVFKDARMTDGG